MSLIFLLSVSLVSLTCLSFCLVCFLVALEGATMVRPVVEPGVEHVLVGLVVVQLDLVVVS